MFAHESLASVWFVTSLQLSFASNSNSSTALAFLMGHGNSNKLYVTHAEHSGLFGQHTASSSGFKAYVDPLLLSCPQLTRVLPQQARRS